jgi:hypothetical protein
LGEEGKAGLILTTVCCAIGGISVALRFYCNAVLKTKYHADDWFILITLATTWTAAGLSFWGMNVARQLSTKEYRSLMYAGLFEGNGLPEYTELCEHPELLERENKYLKAGVSPRDW